VLDLEFEFIADMAATAVNALVVPYFTEQDDSLSFNWRERLQEGENKNLCSRAYVYLNCPYSNPMPWIKKAIESQLDGLGVVMLLNNDTSVGWFAEALPYVSEIRHIVADKKESGAGYHSGRLAFLNADGKPASGNNKAQFILVFNPHKVGAKVTSYVKRSELYGEK
jgi:phage N-6-adenine-methyltransferase